MAAHASDASPFEWRPTPKPGDTTWTCPRCRKVAYRTWAHARADARTMRQHTDQRMVPYWSRRCGSIHVGTATKKPRR